MCGCKEKAFPSYFLLWLVLDTCGRAASDLPFDPITGIITCDYPQRANCIMPYESTSSV